MSTWKSSTSGPTREPTCASRASGSSGRRVTALRRALRRAGARRAGARAAGCRGRRWAGSRRSRRACWAAASERTRRPPVVAARCAIRIRPRAPPESCALRREMPLAFPEPVGPSSRASSTPRSRRRWLGGRRFQDRRRARRGAGRLPPPGPPLRPRHRQRHRPARLRHPAASLKVGGRPRTAGRGPRLGRAGCYSRR